jgi:hypothetical protein
MENKESRANRQVLVPNGRLKIRVANAKEVGVGNPAEETFYHPNKAILRLCNGLSTKFAH